MNRSTGCSAMSCSTFSWSSGSVMAPIVRMASSGLRLHRQGVDRAVVHALLHRRLDEPVLLDASEPLELLGAHRGADVIGGPRLVGDFHLRAGKRRLDQPLYLVELDRHWSIVKT